MSRINIKENSLFSKFDVSLAINDVIANIKHGDSAFLEYGDYEIINPIEIINENMLNYCDIDLCGTYLYKGKKTAITIEGEHLSFHIQKLTTNHKSDFYDNSPEKRLPVGIKIGECNYSDISIDEVEGFSSGLMLAPYKDNTGICYTKFRFKYLSYCYIPLHFAVDDDAVAWINENQFYGGRLKGYFGFKADKGVKQIDECNNNTFYNLAFEAIETNGIDMDFCTFNTVISPRFESVMKYAIREGKTCKSNKYMISVALPLDSINIESSYTDIEAPLHTYWEHMIRRLRTDKDGRKSYEFIHDATVCVSDSYEHLPMNCKNVFIAAGISSSKLQLDKISDFENNQIGIHIRNSMCTLTIIDNDGTTIIDEQELSAGDYSICFMNDKWEFISNTMPKFA